MSRPCTFCGGFACGCVEAIRAGKSVRVYRDAAGSVESVEYVGREVPPAVRPPQTTLFEDQCPDCKAVLHDGVCRACIIRGRIAAAIAQSQGKATKTTPTDSATWTGWRSAVSAPGLPLCGTPSGLPVSCSKTKADRAKTRAVIGERRR